MFARRWIGMVVVAAALALSGRAAAQFCAGPDGYGVPCCTPAVPNLPVIPTVSTDGLYLSFNNCATQFNRRICVAFGAPTPTGVCGTYTIRVTLKLCGGAQLPLWTGLLRAHYSRNFNVSDPVVNAGIWRFMVQGDLRPSAQLISRAGSNANVVPQCYRTFPGVYVTGFIDYIWVCVGNTWSAAWALDHECDAIAHHPSSARPGTFHPGLSYTWVGPAAGFNVDPVNGVIAAAGGTAEALRRNDWPNQPNICLGEEPISNSNISISPPGCVCGSPGTQFIPTGLAITGTCGSQLTAILPSTAPIPLVQKRIGNWTSPFGWPGSATLLLDFGDASYADGCTSTSAGQHFEGVETIAGPFVIDPAGNLLGSSLVDLASSNRPAGARVVGIPHVTWYLVNLTY
jgi:hypothetical protein